MKTVICHFYNEEYLLPWWLKHHKKYFDHGLMINYQSTDKSVEIIKEICPDWDVVDSINSEFSAAKVDYEVMLYESKISGWKITLNVTEFLIGNYSILTEDNLHKEIYVPSFYFVDDNENTILEKDKPLYEQLITGIDFVDNLELRKLRCLHNHKIEYSPGRHFRNYDKTTKDFVIFYYGFSPMNEEFISRKLQIQNKIPEYDRKMGWGNNHYANGKLTLEHLLHMKKTYQAMAKNLHDRMKIYLNML